MMNVTESEFWVAGRRYSEKKKQIVHCGGITDKLCLQFLFLLISCENSNKQKNKQTNNQLRQNSKKYTKFKNTAYQ